MHLHTYVSYVISNSKDNPLRKGNYYYPCFTDEKAEVREAKQRAQGHTAGKEQRWALNPGLSDSRERQEHFSSGSTLIPGRSQTLVLVNYSVLLTCSSCPPLLHAVITFAKWVSHGGHLIHWVTWKLNKWGGSSALLPPSCPLNSRQPNCFTWTTYCFVHTRAKWK